MTLTDAGRKVIFAPGHVRVSGPGVRGIVPTPPPARSPGSQGHGAGGKGKGQPGSHGKGQGNGLAALALALAATSASSGKVVPSPPDVPGAMTLICSQTLAVAQASFDTNTILGGNIPAVYGHLVIKANLRSADAASNRSIFLQFNGDTAANYWWEDLNANNTTVAGSATSSSSIFLGSVPTTTAPAGDFSPLAVEIIDYLNTAAHKTTLALSFARRTTIASGITGDFTGGTWLSTAAVTRIVLFPSGGLNFDVGSRFSLYGIT